ncbi:MAG: hypothetical protein ABTD50_15395 [Polyangiaceae bacterium]|jgi:hypothetical protein
MTLRSPSRASNPTRLRSRVALGVAAVVLTLPPALAFAAKKKAPATPTPDDASASASASSPAAPTPDAAPAADKPAATTEPEPKKPALESVNIAAKAEEPIDYTVEDPTKTYYFIGARYRGTVIPQFLESLFVDDGATVYSNSVGIEFDLRKGGQSMIPWINYTDYSMGDTLFLTKGKDPNTASQYSVVNSGLKAIYFGLDELWSVPMDMHWSFEFGFGVGLGLVFGDLQNNWVTAAANGNPALVASNGLHLYECKKGETDLGCNTGDHQNATVQKAGGYVEPNWFNGGSVPIIFPNIWFPTLGVRYKPIKMFETRLQAGFSLTGFWFGLSADYGLEKRTDSAGAAKRSPAQPSMTF